MLTYSQGLGDDTKRPVNLKNLVQVAGTPTRTFLHNLNQTRYKEGCWDWSPSKRLLMHGQEGPCSVCPHQGHTKMKLAVLQQSEEGQCSRNFVWHLCIAGDKPSSGKGL